MSSMSKSNHVGQTYADARRFQGVGLGLPLAVQLTELHCVTSRIDSEPQAGTAVAVRFPASRITWHQQRQH
jgi:hypothetical protein